MVEDEALVEAAAEAAHGLVFSRLSNAEIEDLDITIAFEDGMLEVDVYLLAPDADVDVDQVAEDAALAARSAVDDRFEEARSE